MMNVKNKLNQISSCFCLAKWLQVTIHLHTGQTHSCHHPPTHKISIDELKTNTSALHNTIYKKALRKQMLNGIRPKECDYCWKIEDTSPTLISDRIIKSSDNWALPYLDEVVSNPWDANIIPRYIEIVFSSTCNFKCAYCLPHISTSWMKEIQELGPYQLSYPHQQLEYLQQVGLIPIEDTKNEYVTAFWNWWPEISSQIEVFRITGGEPLLTPNTFKIMESFLKNPNQSLTLAINSNFGVPESSFQRFISIGKKLIETNSIKKLLIYTSIDTFGAQAEYIRDGLNISIFKKNVEKILTNLPTADLTFMCTFNVMSPPSFINLLQYIEDLKSQYIKSNIILDTSFLRNPHFLSAKILTPEIIHVVKDIYNYCNQSAFFGDYEKEKIKRLYEWLLIPENDNWIRINRKDFADFIHEYDKRRHKSFNDTFPEMKEFLKICAKP